MNRKTLILGISFFVILVILILILSNKNGANKTDNTSAQQVKLIWWNLFEPEENVKSIIDSYTAANPNVSIQYQQVGTGTETIESYKARIINELSDQDILTSPDIFPISNGWAGSFEKLIVPAPTSVFSSTDLSDFYPIVKQDFYKNGKFNAMPLYLDGLAVIYNKDRLKEQNLTVPNKYWSDFQTEAQMLTVKDKDGKIVKPGFSAYYYDNSQFAFDTFNMLLLQQGVKIFDSNGNRVKLEGQSDAQEVVDFYNVFINNSVKTWSEDQSSDIVQFLEGKLAMYIAPSWRIINILNYNKQYNLNLNIGVAKVPQLAAKTEMSWPMYWGQTVSKDCRYPQEAWKFIKYLTQVEQLKSLNNNIIANGRPIGIIYPRLSMTKLIENDQYLGAYATSLLNASDWNMYDRDLMQTAFSKVVKEGLDIKKLDNAIDSVLSIKNITPSVTPTNPK